MMYFHWNSAFVLSPINLTSLVHYDTLASGQGYQEFKVLGSPNSFYFIELAQCLFDLPLGEWGEDETGAFILRTEKNRFGVRKHFVADFFEHRHGETDTLAQIAILDYLVFFGKTRRGAEQLLHNLRNYLRKKSA